MALREFTDSMGRRWEAFAVIPREDERRHYDRRASGEVQVADDAERREGDRRITVGGQSDRIDIHRGWLCFERPGERRRLSPIPDDWTRCEEPQLANYLESARPVRLTTAMRGA